MNTLISSHVLKFNFFKLLWYYFMIRTISNNKYLLAIHPQSAMTLHTDYIKNFKLYVGRVKMSRSTTKQKPDLCYQKRPRLGWADSQISLLTEDQTFFRLTADSGKTGQMPRLSWVFARRKDKVVGFVMLRLKYVWFWYSVVDLKLFYWIPLIRFLYNVYKVFFLYFVYLYNSSNKIKRPCK